MMKSKWRGFKALSAFVFLCFTVLLGIGSGTAHAETFDPAANYKLINQQSGKAMDVEFESFGQGANIHQWNYVGKLNQQWKIQSTGDGYFKIVNANSGKVADVQGPSTSNGANIHQWDYVGADNQKWSFVPVGSSYKIVSKYSGKVIDVQFNSSADGANIHQWEYVSGITSQLWKIEKIEAPISTIDPTRYYKIKDTYSQKVMDVWSASTSVMKVQLWDYTGDNNQRWKIVPFGDGSYTITAKHSAKVITARTCTGTKCLIQQWDPDGWVDQRWILEPQLNGSYKIKNRSGGYIYGGGDLYKDSSFPEYYNTWNLEIVE